MHHGYGFEIGVFVFFVVGSAFNVWRHAASIVNSKLNGITTYGQFFKVNGAAQSFKTFGALCFLMWWQFNQPAVANLANTLWPSAFGTAPGWLISILTVTPATAGAFGLFWDVIADIAIVYAKKKWPTLFPSEVPPTVASSVQKEAAIDAVTADLTASAANLNGSIAGVQGLPTAPTPVPAPASAKK